MTATTESQQDSPQPPAEAVQGPAFRLVVDPTGALAEASRRCEADAFLRRYGNTREQLDTEYSPYDAQCRWISLVDRDDEVVATARLTAPGPMGNKTFDDCAHDPWFVDARRALRSAGVDPEGVWDITTISVRRGTRRATLASAALYYGMIQTMRAAGASATVAVLDTRVRALLETFGLVYRAIPGTCPAPYLGSPESVPVYSPFAWMMDEQRRRMPDCHRLVASGIGLDDIELPPAEAFRWTPHRFIDLDRTDETALCAAPSDHPDRLPSLAPAGA